MKARAARESASEFRLALEARAIMATAVNRSAAIDGYGDIGFALRQLEYLPDFLRLLHRNQA